MSEATAGEVWHQAALVIRERGRWSLCRVDERDPRDVDRGALVALTDPAPPPATSTPMAAGEGVSPVGPIALLVRDGRLWAFDRTEGGLRWLTSCELDVLDGLDAPQRAAAVIAAHGPRSADALVALESAGLVERGADVDGHDPSAAVAAEAQVWPTSFVRPDGSWQQLDPTRIPVLPAYVPTSGPPLALGLINALARTWEGGVLNERFDLRPPVTIDEARILLEGHDGPAVLLCSNYMWTSVQNHELAAWAKARNPATITVHGGPDTPKYEDDLIEFLRLPSVDIAVIGEGEAAAIEVLTSLAADGEWASFHGLDQVDGVAYTDAAGTVVRTADRSRRTELDSLPSPYLSGEFDDLHPVSWDSAFEGAVVIETNRGCPYACAFCDWGSATMSRIRMFEMDRVKAEMRWLADREVSLWMLADANVGIMSRDKEIARHVADLRRETGVPLNLGINTAKNTTKHLTEILQSLFEAGVGTVSSLALQTRDEHVLETINRSNIAPSQYDQLCATFRSLGLPIMCDFVLGLPGQTSTSFKADLQWAIDHEVTARAWMAQMLPNAPMNDPAYRAEHQIVIDDEGIVVSTATFDLADHRRMRQLRTAVRVFEHFGLLRHVLRWLQWDHGLPAMEVLDDLVARTERDPSALPFTSWALRYFDYFPVPPVSWQCFYDEIRRYVTVDLGVPDGSALRSVLDVQQAIMPERGRTFPMSAALDHDYVAYYRGATQSLASDGRSTLPLHRLEEYGPGTIDVFGDPADLTSWAFRRLEEVRPSDLLPRAFWHLLHYELDSPLTRFVAEVRANGGYRSQPEPAPASPRLEDAPSETVQLVAAPIRRKADVR